MSFQKLGVMGIHTGKGNAGFAKYANGEYVDKTGMIAHINSTLGGANMLTCVTCPRRFGKSMAANMLCAYLGNQETREF